MDKVYLVGLPASGKTTIGRWLAQKMHWQFFDLDEAIVAESGLSVWEFFHVHGEDAFRQLETDLLRKTVNQHKCVIACGGGTSAHSNNMDWMCQHGLTVFLNPDLGVIQTRIHANPNERPLFEGHNLIEIREKLQEMLTNRCNFYHKSKIIWNKSQPSDFLQVAVNQLIE